MKPHSYFAGNRACINCSYSFIVNLTPLAFACQKGEPRPLISTSRPDREGWEEWRRKFDRWTVDNKVEASGICEEHWRKEE